MKPESTPTNVILAVIRGELPLSTLSEVGVPVAFTEQSCEVERKHHSLLPPLLTILSAVLSPTKTIPMT